MRFQTHSIYIPIQIEAIRPRIFNFSHDIFSTFSKMNKKEEDSKFLESLKEELKDSYTEKDAEFMKYINEPSPSPPILRLRRRPQSNYRPYQQHNRQQNNSQHHRQHNYNRSQPHRDSPDRSNRANRHEPYARRN